MLTLIVRVALVAELLAALAIGAWLVVSLGWGESLAAAAVIATIVGIRLALVLSTFTVAWTHRSPREARFRIGPGATLAMMLDELGALLAGYFLRLPFPDAVLRADPPPGSHRHMPVVLAHGYLANRGYFAPTVAWLEERGIEAIHVPSFPSVFSTIEAYADELHRRIEEIVRGEPGAKVALVCHSMGGLAARCYLQRHGTRRVARLVTIGSPHHGTALAPFGIGRHAAQMRLGSPFLAALADAERATPPEVPAVSIYSTHDNMVAPQATSRLDWATSFPVAGVGHIRMVVHEPVLERVLEELRAAGAAPR
jgi:triacylglycerol esterase/lipase EstA (alpha/beta hydrolase family)